jgi:hypothetical protein
MTLAGVTAAVAMTVMSLRDAGAATADQGRAGEQHGERSRASGHLGNLLGEKQT